VIAYNKQRDTMIWERVICCEQRTHIACICRPYPRMHLGFRARRRPVSSVMTGGGSAALARRSTLATGLRFQRRLGGPR
jgi:hypothetical protein